MDPSTLTKAVILLTAQIELPGVLISYVLMPKADLIERIGLGFIFGLTPSFVLYAVNRVFHLPISPLMVSLTVILISIICVVITMAQKEEKNG